MNNHQSLVREFHAKFGLTINDTPTLSPQDDKLRVELIREEKGELKQGIERHDRIEIADACADLAYVIYGAGVTYGILINNMYDARETPGRDIVGEMEDSLATLAYWLERGDLRMAYCSLSSLLSDVEEIARFYSIPLAECFEEVHRSNMSKLWTEVEVHDRSKGVAVEFVNPMTMTIRWVDGWSATQVGEEGRCWVVKNEIHKAKKSPSYSPADIAGVLARHEKQAA